MKILYYSPHPHLHLDAPAGYGTHMREMIQSFADLGHDVHPVIMGNNDSTFSNGEKLSFKKKIKKYVPATVWGTVKDFHLLQLDQSFRKDLIKKIDTTKPDLIYERANYLQLSGIKAAKSTGVKHFMEYNAPYTASRYVSGSTLLHPIVKKTEKFQLKNTDKIIVSSSVFKEYYLNKYPIEESKIIYRPMGINPEKVIYDKQAVQEIKKRYDLNGKLVIGFVGSLFEWNGLEILFDAVSELENLQDYRVFIVGDGYTMDSLRRRVFQLGLDDFVKFTGNVPNENIYNYIQTMDITVLPNSHWYGTPVKIFEYAAMGKPIIAVDIGPIKDVMQDGIDGILIKRNSVSLKQGLNRLIKDKTLREKTGTNFQRKVFKNYTWNSIAEKILDNDLSRV